MMEEIEDGKIELLSSMAGVEILLASLNNNAKSNWCSNRDIA